MSTQRAIPGPATGGAPELSRDTPREVLADAVVHVVGLVAAVVGCVVLVVVLAGSGGWRGWLSVGLYGVGLLGMLGCSALHNLVHPAAWTPRLQRFDHAAIFVMIAGTYTPVALLGLGGRAGWALAGAIWSGALVGAALKLVASARFERATLFAYLLLSWIGVAAMEVLIARLPTADIALLLGGGLLYSLGVPVHLAARLPYHTALWHGFVVAAAACHYAVVLRLVIARG